MKPAASAAWVLVAATAALAGCASSPTTIPAAPPDAPPALRPPAGQAVYLEALATGVQIYECAAKPGQPDAFQWMFRAPEATLVDRAGKPLGKHYAGPTWESTDGSLVKGELKASDPGPTASAVPWLLLGAKSTSGSGIFTPTTSVQRLKTVGGVAPTIACTSANAKQVERVPYTASYYFYRAG